jgi:hypothetical protein
MLAGSQLLMLLSAVGSHAFLAGPVRVLGPHRSPPRSPPVLAAHWMDYLKFGGSTPPFDVLERTKEFAALQTDAEIISDKMVSYFADDYVFRGSIIGPIAASEVQDTQKVCIAARTF